MHALFEQITEIEKVFIPIMDVNFYGAGTCFHYTNFRLSIACNDGNMQYGSPIMYLRNLWNPKEN